MAIFWQYILNKVSTIACLRFLPKSKEMHAMTGGGDATGHPQTSDFNHIPQTHTHTHTKLHFHIIHATYATSVFFRIHAVETSSMGTVIADLIIL